MRNIIKDSYDLDNEIKPMSTISEDYTEVVNKIKTQELLLKEKEILDLQEDTVSDSESETNSEDIAFNQKLNNNFKLEMMEMKEETIRQAKIEAEIEAEKIKKEAFEKGLSEGISKGYEEGLQRALNSKNQLLEELKNVVEGIYNARKKYTEDVKGELLNISLAIAEKIIRKALKEDKNTIMHMITSATDKINDKKWAKIYISSENVEASVEGSTNLFESLNKLSDNIKFITMDDVDEGTCIIELPDSIIDASINTQVENVKNIIKSY